MRRDVVGKMSAPPAKKLPWTYHYALGYKGRPIDEIKAKQIAERVGVNACNVLGHTPLIVAAMLGRTRMVEWLLRNGAAVDLVATGGLGETALIAACTQKRIDSAVALLNAGASLKATDNFGNTPLASAFNNCFTDPIPIAEMLIRRGAVITRRVREAGKEWDTTRFSALLKKVRDEM